MNEKLFNNYCDENDEKKKWGQISTIGHKIQENKRRKKNTNGTSKKQKKNKMKV